MKKHESLRNIHKHKIKSEIHEQGLNVIIADTEWKTFERLTGFDEKYNFLNLSSNFAVTFILEYEKVDMAIISQKISGIESIKKLAERKHATLFILGKDLKYPADRDEIQSVLEKELLRKIQKSESGSKKSISALFGNLFKGKRRTAEAESSDKKESQEFKNSNTEKKCEEAYFEEDLEELDLNTIRNNDLKSKSEPEQSDDPFNDFFNETGNKNSNFWDESHGKYNFDKNHEKENPEKVSVAGDENIQENKKKDVFMIAIKQKTIVFIKAKGGVGSTVLSLYLANKFSKLKTLLVDMNFSEGGGDLGYYLDLPRTPNIMVFTEGYSRSALDCAVLNIKDNLDILQAPPTYELSKKIDLQDIYSLADVARKKYHLIIFDLPNHIDDISIGVLDLADLAVLVSDYSVGSFGRLTDICNRFIYSDLDRVWVLNKKMNGNYSRIVRDGLSELPEKQEIVSLSENRYLLGRYDFVKFDFNCLTDFEVFDKKILDRLTCD